LAPCPTFIDDFNVPIYANKLTLAFINERLKRPLSGRPVPKVSMHEIFSETPEIKLGNFAVKAFGVNHSVPGGLGFAIKTPQGVVMHVSDYKIDWTRFWTSQLNWAKSPNSVMPEFCACFPIVWV